MRDWPKTIGFWPDQLDGHYTVTPPLTNHGSVQVLPVALTDEQIAAATKALNDWLFARPEWTDANLDDAASVVAQSLGHTTDNHEAGAS